MEKLSIRLAKTRRKLEQHRLFRLLGGRGAATLALGAALSIGGLTEAIDGVHFVVEKDLDAVRVVRQNGSNDVVVAKVADGFAANTVFNFAISSACLRSASSVPNERSGHWRQIRLNPAADGAKGGALPSPLMLMQPIPRSEGCGRETLPPSIRRTSGWTLFLAGQAVSVARQPQREQKNS